MAKHKRQGGLLLPPSKRPGGPCDAACPRCEGQQPHTIVSLIYGRPDRVICHTCRSHHNLAPITGAVKLKESQE